MKIDHAHRSFLAMATPSDETDYDVQRDFAREPQRQSTNRNSQTFAQEAFAQTKVMELYVKTCSVLQPRKYLVDTFQETVLWRQPLLSVLLYLCVHSAFWSVSTLGKYANYVVRRIFDISSRDAT